MKEKNVDLKKYNTYGIGGIAKIMYHPKSCEELLKTIKSLKKDEIPYFILGGGSNIILPDDDFNGVVIKLDLMNDIIFNNNEVEVSAGVSLSFFINTMLKEGYTNLANLFGIPGTVGGAIIGNAGSFGKETFDDLKSIKYIDEDNEIKEILKSDIDYGYRNTEFKNSNKIIVSAIFNCYKGNVSDARDIIKKNMESRREKQPLEYKNAGSVFKNPFNYKAAYLIDKAGLKGLKVGDAMVSLKHANFIVNVGNATSNDIRQLISIIKQKVYDKFKVKLELEQLLIEW